MRFQLARGILWKEKNQFLRPTKWETELTCNDKLFHGLAFRKRNATFFDGRVQRHCDNFVDLGSQKR